METKKQPPKTSPLHPRSKHHGRYDLDALVLIYPGLKAYVAENKYGNLSIDFFNPNAVKALNTALITKHYHISFWEIPSGYLCPPIPGRADYIHYLADLLAETNGGTVPRGTSVKCLDVGVGASCIYPIIGISEYDWSFVGSDIDEQALKSCGDIIKNNPGLHEKIVLQKQSDSAFIFKNIIEASDNYDAVICNPPFHASEDEARQSSRRKVNNLKNKKVKLVVQNFGGQPHELWCEGGELAFVKKMITESKSYSHQVQWFTCLVSKESLLPVFREHLHKMSPKAVKVIDMGQGNKKSRMLAWRF